MQHKTQIDLLKFMSVHGIFKGAACEKSLVKG